MNNLNRLTSSIIVVSLFFTQVVLAKESIDQLEECAKISQDTARLTCFDKITEKFSSKSVEAKTTQVVTQQIDDFSKEHIEKTAEEKAKEVLSISLTISQLNKTLHGEWKITFTNGQKWLQKDSIRLKLSEGDQVTLTKGAFNSVFLKKENSNKRIKVKRLK